MIWLVKEHKGWSAVDVDHATVGTGETHREALGDLATATDAYIAACAFTRDPVARPVGWRWLAKLIWLSLRRRAYPYSTWAAAAAISVPEPRAGRRACARCGRTVSQHGVQPCPDCPDARSSWAERRP